MCRFAARSTGRPLSTRRHCLSSRPDEDKHIELTANLCYHSSFYLWLHEWIKNKRKYLRNTFERYSHFPVGKGENAGKQVSEGLIKFYLVAAQFYTVLPCDTGCTVGGFGFCILGLPFCSTGGGFDFLPNNLLILQLLLEDPC